MTKNDEIDCEQVIHTVHENMYPASLKAAPSPPKQLYVRASHQQVFGQLMQRHRVAIVGSRDATIYGEQMTRKFASELAAHGVVIVSGMALGIDGVAHRAALDVGGLTFAVLPSSVTQIHPKTHSRLAHDIINSGGALVSEYAPDAVTYKPNFVARNRIVAGLANALLITEAAENSGSLHTARFALEQGIDVLAVPGNINSPLSAGTNNLIKSGATPVTSTADILYSLNIEPVSAKGTRTARPKGSNHEEQLILDLLEQGIYLGSKLLEKSGLTIERLNHNLTMLELRAKIRPLGANQWGLR